MRRRVGYLPDNFALYDQMTPVEYLDFFAPLLRGRRTDAAASASTRCSRSSTSTQKRAAPIRTLSRGMRQRLGVAKTLVHDPKVLLLDEPASALDPGARMKLRDALLRLKRRGLAMHHLVAHPARPGRPRRRGGHHGGRAHDPLPAPSTRVATQRDGARGLRASRCAAAPTRRARALADFGPRLRRAATSRRPGAFEVELDGGADAVADLVEALVLRGARAVARRAARVGARGGLPRQRGDGGGLG